MSGPTDDPPLFGGVWVGRGPPPDEPPRPKPAPPPVWPPLLMMFAGVLLAVAGGAANPEADGRAAAAVAAGGLMTFVGAFLTVRRRARAERRWRKLRPASPGAVCVIDTPPAPAAAEPDRDAELMALCGNDIAVYDRLVERERRRHPRLARSEWVRLAVRHFRRDKG